MKRLFTILLIVVGFAGTAQQDVQFTHFKDYALYYNPAYVGGNGICANLLGRHQWMGFNGAPTSYYFDAKYKAPVIRGSVGLAVIDDQLGFQKSTHAKLTYAYAVPMNLGGELYLGVSAGLHHGAWGTGYIPPESMQDPSIPFSGTSDNMFDIDLGAYYRGNGVYMGLSVTHLNEGKFTSGNNNQFNFDAKRHYYVLAGYKTNILPNVELEPMILAKSDGASTQIDLQALATLNNRFFGGINYRLSDAVSPVIGAKWGDNNTFLRFSYSYDITTSNIRNYSSGSHELMLGVCKKIGKTHNERSVNPLWLGNYDLGPKK